MLLNTFLQPSAHTDKTLLVLPRSDALSNNNRSTTTITSSKDHIRTNQNITTTRKQPEQRPSSSSKTTSIRSSPNNTIAFRRQRSARMSVGLEPLPEEEGWSSFNGQRFNNMTTTETATTTTSSSSSWSLKLEDSDCRSSDSGFVEGSNLNLTMEAEVIAANTASAK